MKVFSVVDNIAPPKAKNRTSGRAARKKLKKQKSKIPPRENVSADEIRARVAAHTSKVTDEHKMTKARLAKLNASRLPDLDDVDKKDTVGDLGTNDPNDLATHGKLKSVLSMNSFNFSDKEKATLEKILKD